MEKLGQITSTLSEDKAQLLLKLSGRWGLEEIHKLDSPMAELQSQDTKEVTVDCGEICYLDTAGAWLIVRFIYAQKKKGIKVVLRAVDKNWQPLLQDVSSTIDYDAADEAVAKLPAIQQIFQYFLEKIKIIKKDSVVALHILGLAIISCFSIAGHKREGIFTATIVQLQKIGLNAVLIIGTMAFIVGAIITQQGAFQLRKFGAELFVVDMDGILILREMGVLITAILIAGRSGSAITAELGAMKMREEIDALKVMGLDPIKILVFPRIFALMIAMPLLAIIANVFGLVGAALVSDLYSHIDYGTFLHRLATNLNTKSYILGLIKAPFLAIVIGFVSCIEGFKVKGSAESLGAHVTSSVVKTIFGVIVVDALFAILYVTLGY